LESQGTFALEPAHIGLPEDGRVYDSAQSEEMESSMSSFLEGAPLTPQSDERADVAARVSLIEAAVGEILSSDDTVPKRIPRPQLHRKRQGGPCILTWNINGLRGFLKSEANVNSLRRLISHERPAIVVLTETKLTVEKKDVAITKLLDVLPVSYNVHSAESSGRKGYAGVAVLVRHDVSYHSSLVPTSGIPPRFFDGGGDREEETTRGRVLMVPFEGCTLIAVYAPNSGGDLRFLDYREKWDLAFRRYVKEIRGVEGVRPLIIAGDLNVCGSPLDIGDTREEAPHSPSIQPSEVAAFSRLLEEAHLSDTLRVVHPQEEGIYSFYCNPREKKLNYGRRIDYILISADERHGVIDASVFFAEYGLGYRPDHSPILAEFRASLLGTADVGVQCEESCGAIDETDVIAEVSSRASERKSDGEMREARRRLLQELVATLHDVTLSPSVRLDLLAPLLCTGDVELEEDVRDCGVRDIVAQLVCEVEAADYPLKVLPRLDEDFMWVEPRRSTETQSIPDYKPVKPRPPSPTKEVEQWLKSHLNLDETCVANMPNERAKLEALIMRHWDVFDYEGRNLPEMTGVFHEIQLVDGAQPVYCAPYRMSPEQKQALEEHVKELLSQDLIEPSQ
ncbi:DNA-(apurinic or apyrimidinic site) lyase, partial [Perkinsus olseni]